MNLPPGPRDCSEGQPVKEASLNSSRTAAKIGLGLNSRTLKKLNLSAAQRRLAPSAQ